MFHFQIIQQPDFSLNSKIIEKIFLQVSKTVKKMQSGLINIVFLSDEEIQELNKNYRNIDKTTDVLSFHYYEDFTNFEKYDTVGEIILSEAKILEQGKLYGLGSEKECYKLIIHSLLHILGYDHETDEDYAIMKPLEEEVWEKVFST